MTTRIRGLYAITPVTDDADWLCRAVREALEGGAAAIQYRFKALPLDQAVDIARRLVAECRAHGRPLIVNDSVEVMLAADASGVHLGRDDEDPVAVRRRIGPDRLIGVSCYDDFERALRLKDVADHVAFGSVFASAVKPDARRAPLSLFGQARAQAMNTVAIGGITAGNADEVLKAGADALAVITGVFGQQDVRRAARQLADLAH